MGAREGRREREDVRDREGIGVREGIHVVRRTWGRGRA